MKNVLYALLMLVAITPALACGAFDCEPIVNQEPPCHESSEPLEEPSGPMLFKDCSNLDLHYYHAPEPELEPVLQLLNYYIAFALSDADYLVHLLPVQKSRAPPDYLHPTGPAPLYLSTLRIRI